MNMYVFLCVPIVVSLADHPTLRVTTRLSNRILHGDTPLSPLGEVVLLGPKMGSLGTKGGTRILGYHNFEQSPVALISCGTELLPLSSSYILMCPEDANIGIFWKKGCPFVLWICRSTQVNRQFRWFETSPIEWFVFLRREQVERRRGPSAETWLLF